MVGHTGSEQREGDTSIAQDLAKIRVTKKEEGARQESQSEYESDSDFIPVGFDYDGFNSMAAGIVHVEKPEAEEKQVVDIFSYEFLLARIEKHLKLSDQQAESKVKIPMSIKRDGATKTSFNITDVCSVIKRDIAHLRQYIEVELSVNCSIDGDGRLIIKGVFPEAQIQKLVRNYIKQYVTCGICSSLSTVLEREEKLLFKKCQACGASQSVNNIQQGYKALTTKRSLLRRKNAE